MAENLKNKIIDFVEIDAYLKSRGISPAQARILHIVINCEEPTLMNICSGANRALSTVHQQLNDLVSKGFLSRDDKEGDIKYYWVK